MKTSASRLFAPRSSVAALRTRSSSAFWQKPSVSVAHAAVSGLEFCRSFSDPRCFCAKLQELFHDDLKIEAIHAGLECGLFSDAIPGLDAGTVNFYDPRGSPHTPADEHLPLDSCERF